MVTWKSGLIRMSYLVRIGDLESGCCFVTNDDIVEDKFILIFTVNTTARQQIMTVISENIQILYNALLLEDLWDALW